MSGRSIRGHSPAVRGRLDAARREAYDAKNATTPPEQVAVSRDARVAGMAEAMKPAEHVSILLDTIARLASLAVRLSGDARLWREMTPRDVHDECVRQLNAIRRELDKCAELLAHLGMQLRSNGGQ
jgi:hypothetical protein